MICRPAKGRRRRQFRASDLRSSFSADPWLVIPLPNKRTSKILNSSELNPKPGTLVIANPKPKAPQSRPSCHRSWAYPRKSPLPTLKCCYVSSTGLVFTSLTHVYIYIFIYLCIYFVCAYVGVFKGSFKGSFTGFIQKRGLSPAVSLVL